MGQNGATPAVEPALDNTPKTSHPAEVAGPQAVRLVATTHCVDPLRPGHAVATQARR